MTDEIRYTTFTSYLKNRYGKKVRRISLDAGFSCPNRDGTAGTGGCIFCAPRSFSPYAGSGLALAEQIRWSVEAGRKKGMDTFMAYFQAYTNTHAPVPELQAAYDTVREFPEIKLIGIGTRPDAVDAEKLRLISSYTDEYEVWIEYGLQSANDATLRRINRGHDAAAFARAVNLTRSFPEIKICAHVILGLPGETEEDEIATARFLADLMPEGIKLHPLHAVRGTALAAEHAAGRWRPLSREDYVRRAVSFLEHLPVSTVVQRLSADCPREALAAPDWLTDKPAVLAAIRQRMKELDTRQGKAYNRGG